MAAIRVIEVLPDGRWDAARADDRALLDHDARHRRRFTHRTLDGLQVLVDLPRAIVLADGDGLKLEDGRIVAVEAAPEALMEITAADAESLMRLAWHVGNRHLPTEVRADRLRLRNDHVIAAMLDGLGATVTDIQAPFSPESGAYSGAGEHSHSHGHDHHDGPGHHHHHDGKGE